MNHHIALQILGSLFIVCNIFSSTVTLWRTPVMQKSLLKWRLATVMGWCVAAGLGLGYWIEKI